MKQTLPTLDLISYLYGEASPAQIRAAEAAIAADPVNRNELTELQIAKASFPKVMFNAPRRVLRKILGHSEQNQQLVCC